RQSYKIYYSMGRLESASGILVMLAEYEYLHGSLNTAKKINYEALQILKQFGNGDLYLNARLQELLIERKINPSRQTFTKLTQLYDEGTNSDLEIKYEIAQEVSLTAQMLNLLPESLY